MALEFDFRISAGWIAKATLEGSDSYGLENLAVQSTYQVSKYLYPWMCLSEDDQKTTYADYRRVTRTGGLYEIADGDIFWFWCFKVLTPDMIDYWELTFPTNTQVTVKTRKKASTFGVYQAFIINPRQNVYDRIYGNAIDYRPEFFRATELV